MTTEWHELEQLGELETWAGAPEDFSAELCNSISLFEHYTEQLITYIYPLIMHRFWSQTSNMHLANRREGICID